MKTAVFSDSHGSSDEMLRAVRDFCPDTIIHLGDGRRDTEIITREFPDIPVYTVSGNCDGDYPEESYKIVSLDGHKAFITHGHRYGVRFSGLSALLYAAECCGCDIAMFGHTHEALCTDCGGIKVINPGSIGRGKPKSWVKLEINGDDISCETVKA